MRPHIIATVLLGLSIAGRAPAVVVESEDGPCPTGGGFTRVFQLVSQNTHGGWDSDGARYSSSGQYRRYALSTCSEDLLTLYGTDMRQAFTDRDKAALRPISEQVRAEVADPRTLTLWDRYRLAADFYRALDRDHLFLARVYVAGSWTVRDQAVGYFEGLEGPVATRILLDAGPEALAGATDATQERILLFNLARVAHRGGYLSERDAFLDRLRARQDLVEAEREALARLEIAVVEEPRLQDLAIAELEAYLRGRDGTAQERLEATFLLGDLMRRRGRTSEALAWYLAVKATPDAPDALVELSAYLAAELGGERPWEGRTPEDLTPAGQTPPPASP